MLLAIAIAAAAFIHISIAASQLLLAIGIVLLVSFRRKLIFPRIWIPLAAFLLWTILADFLSPDPWTGRAQIKKFFVFLFIPLIYGVFVRQFSKAFYLVAAWVAAATASGLWSLVQFCIKYQTEKNAPEGFYVAYLRRRITGFESHWMTFGALQLSVLALLLAQYFFSNRRMPAWAYSSTLILSAAILLGWTRSIWLATAVSLLYLVWVWRPKMILAVPVIFAVLVVLSPKSTRQRFTSILQPQADVDSNQHRYITFRTGLRMIEAHPWFGIGPEEIGRNFVAYLPADIRPPLPEGFYGHLHSIYLQYAAERGIPALLLILAAIGLAAWDCAQAIRKIGPERSQGLFVLHGTLAVILGVLAVGIFEYNLGDSEVLMMFVSVLALGYAAIDNPRMRETKAVISR
jgi:putative inorganic carbon (HCO3(-)) transporter